MGHIAGGAMWIKNFTPAGFVGYLATNYGYDKLMQLAEGNIEQGKKHLTQFFVNHDQDITQEQATYLANFTMHVLTDVGGRMVFHHAAAKGWQKVGRGVNKVKQTAGSSDVIKSLQQALPNKDAFLKSADTAWKGGTQGTLSVAGRALQKHAGRAGSAFSDVQFSGKTANQDAMRVIKQILNSKNQVVEVAPRGGYEIYDPITKRGFSVSRNGLFNGFRNYQEK